MAEDTPPWEDYSESPVQVEDIQGPWEDYAQVKPALPKAQSWQLTPEGTKPYGGPYSGGPFSPYQEVNMEEAVASLTTPNIRIPQLQPKGLPAKILAGPINLGSGIVEGATSPFGAAMMGLPATKVTRPIFTAIAAKQAYDAARRARETQDPQDISAAIAAGSFAGLLARGHVPRRTETPVTKPVTGVDLPMPEGAVPPPAPRLPKSVVPETPEHVRETVVEEARRVGADTVNKVLKQFPSLEGNRERAKVIRDAAFPKETPKTAPSEPEIAAETTAAEPAPETPPTPESVPEPASEPAVATPAPVPEPIPSKIPQSIEEAWKMYDEDTGIQTVRDLADAIEGLAGEGKVPKYVQRALNKYRDALEEDFEMAGRGDVEPAEESFLDAVEKHALKLTKKSKTIEAEPEPPKLGPEPILGVWPASEWTLEALKKQTPAQRAQKAKYLGLRGAEGQLETGFKKLADTASKRLEEIQAPKPEPLPESEQAAEQARLAEEIGEEPTTAPVAEVTPADANPEKAPELVGMGGAIQSEFEGGAGADIYGIAARVREQRAKAGQTTPIAPGEGVSAQDAIQRGRDILTKDPLAAQKIEDAFRKTGTISDDSIAVTRAKGEEAFLAARRIEEKFGTDSAEYRNAFENGVKWDKLSKEMQTVWHKAGQAQQGHTDIDTGSFTGLARAFKDATGKEFTEPQKLQAQRIADAVKNTVRATDQSKEKINVEVSKLPTVEVPDAVTARKVFGDYKPGTPMTPEQVSTLWNYAKRKYLDRMENDFDRIQQGLATDLGLSKADVARGLTQPKTLKRATKDMYAKMGRQRDAISAAKSWLQEAQYPGWERAMRSIPRVFFAAKVFGHGTVGMITHAGINVFNPGAWKTYWPNFMRQYGLMFSRGYHERMMQQLVNDPLYAEAQKFGLKNNPFKYADDYQNYSLTKWFKKIGLVGNRGFDALKLFRQARFSQLWNAAPESVRTPEFGRWLADNVNHATGIVKTSLPGAYGEIANLTMFAPRLEASRWAFLLKDPVDAARTFLNWRSATAGERYGAISELKQKATIAGTYFGLLALNQGFLSATGSDEKINFSNPMGADFLAFKAAGHKVGVVGPMIGIVRLFAQLAHTAFGERSKYEKTQPRLGEIGKELIEYGRGKLSPFAGTVTDIATGTDFYGRPLPVPWAEPIPRSERLRGKTELGWGEYASTQFTPIPVSEAIREVWHDQGMSDDEIRTYLKAIMSGVFMGGTGVRLSETKGQ